MSESTVSESWEKHLTLVLNQLEKLTDRLDSLEMHIEKKLDRTFSSYKADQDVMRKEVFDVRIEMAVLKKDISMKTAILAFTISTLVTVLIKYLS
jgi:predicted  nucleic acid-binding Zn-ribbon protein